MALPGKLLSPFLHQILGWRESWYRSKQLLTRDSRAIARYGGPYSFERLDKDKASQFSTLFFPGATNGHSRFIFGDLFQFQQ